MFGDIGQTAFLIFIGAVAGFVTSQFFRTLLSSQRYKRGFAELERERDQALIELYTRQDISDRDRALTEVSITRTFARQLDALDEEVARTNKILLYFAGSGGTFGIIVLLYQYFDRIRDLLTHVGSLVLLSTPALAATEGKRTELAPFIPYVAMAVLGLMGISFLVALGTILVVKDTRENQARIKAADNIVKTFGGFFTGLATTLIH